MRLAPVRERIAILGVVAGTLVAVPACNDESRTTGTMVQVSEEAKAHQKSKAEAYKGGPKAKTKAVHAEKP